MPAATVPHEGLSLPDNGAMSTPATSTSQNSKPWRHVLWLWCALCLLGPFSTVQAQSGSRVALVIGNSQYQHESPLRNPGNDARLMAKTLTALGFEVDLRLDLTKREMDEAISRFIRTSSGASSAFMYYAGHGMQPFRGGRNMLLPVDSKVENDDTLDAHGIAADTIVERLEQQSQPAGVRVVILDACRNNPRLVSRVAGRWRGDVARGLSPPKRPHDEFTLIAFATTDQNIALDGEGANSPYAQALANHLAGADRIPLLRIFELTADDVLEATQRQQRPRTFGDLDSRVGLDARKLPSNSSLTPDLEHTAWEAARAAGTLAALDTFLAEFPNGRYAASARVVRTSLLAKKPVVVVPPRGPVKVGKPVVDCEHCPPLVPLPTGSYQRGATDADPWASDSEGPVHTVHIRHRLALGLTEVTRRQFAAFVQATGYLTDAERNVGEEGCYVVVQGVSQWQAGRHWRNPGFAQTEEHPAVCLSWNDAQAYLAWLNTQAPGKGYRLPTEAEWEYAARAGQGERPFPWAKDSDTAAQCAHANGADASAAAVVPGASTWTVADCDDGYAYTAPVGRFKPNPFGLHDLHGNAFEWLQDTWHANYDNAPTDGRAWAGGNDSSRHVVRGGSWDYSPKVLRSAYRIAFEAPHRTDGTGFRIARPY